MEQNCEKIAIIYLDQLLAFCDMRQEQFVIRPFPSPPAALERMRTFLKLRSTHSSRTGSSRDEKLSSPETITSAAPGRRTETHLGPDEKCTHAAGCVLSGAHAAAGRNIFSGETHTYTRDSHLHLRAEYSPQTHICGRYVCPRETSFSGRASRSGHLGRRPGRRG
jgi:hypothetical protein